jgi:large subunit ribosomal protein L20
MARVKGGIVTRRRHKKVLKFTRGQWDTKHKLYRRAHEAMMKSLSYAYRDRRNRKRDMRRLWIARINAGARQLGVKYSQLMHDLKTHNIELDRKMLADIAARDPQTFRKIVEAATA